MHIKPFRFLTVFLVAAAVAVPALGAVLNPDTFVFATFSGADSLDPAYAYDTSSAEVIYHCYDALIAYDGSSIERFVPELATEVPSIENGLITADGMTIRFPIRRGVRFHNGAELTPDDVEYTFERAMLADPAGGPNWMFFEPLTGEPAMADLVRRIGGPDEIKDMRRVDPAILRQAFDIVDRAIETEKDAVVFHLAKPYVPFLHILTGRGSCASILNERWMIEKGAWDGLPETWPKWYDQPKEKTTLYEREMGTGPFMMQPWKHGDGQIVLTRFEGYWRGPARLAKAVIKYVDNTTTRILMLKMGEADAIYINRSNLNQVKNFPGIVVVDDLPAIANTTLLFNWTIPTRNNKEVLGSGKLDGRGIPPDFFADVNVRRGFCKSFHYQAYIGNASMGKAIIPVGPAPGILPFVDKTQPYHQFDPLSAAQEFKQAFGGQLWEKGFTLTLYYNTGNTSRGTAARFIATGVGAINPKFKVEVEPMDWDKYSDKLRASELPVFFIGWHLDYPDVHNFYHPYMHSRGSFAGYCGAALQELARKEFDQLIEEGAATADPAKRQEIYGSLQRLYRDYAVGMPYMESIDLRVHREWVKGFYYNPANCAWYDFYTIRKES